MSSFAKMREKDRFITLSKALISYWELQPFFAFGMGSTSLLNERRFARPSSLSKYYRYIKEIEELGVL